MADPDGQRITLQAQRDGTSSRPWGCGRIGAEAATPLSRQHVREASGLFAVVFSASLAFGPCGSPQSPEQPSPPSGNQVTGQERIGWDQPGASASTVQAYVYWAYVDGVRFRLGGVECASTAGAQGFACSAPLPPLASGQHTLELAAASGDGAAALESPRSAALIVVKVGSGLNRLVAIDVQPARPPSSAITDPPSFVTAESTTLLAQEVAEVKLPTALRFAPDGRLFVAEQRGLVRLVVNGQLQAEPALVLDDVVVGPTAGLLGMVLDPEFDRTHHVYVIYTVPGREGIEKQVVRFREVGGRLAEGAVLLGGIPAMLVDDSAGLEFGPDGKLYVATGTPIDIRRLDEPLWGAGQVLRLNRDGTTPDDNPAYSPIVLRWLRRPVAVAWLGEDGSRVAIEAAAPPAGAGTTAVSASDGRLSVSPAPSAAAVCRNSSVPAFRPDLFIAVPERSVLLRVKVASAPAFLVAGQEPLLLEALGPVAVVACGVDGDLYVATRHADGEVHPDRIFRLHSP